MILKAAFPHLTVAVVADDITVRSLASFCQVVNLGALDWYWKLPLYRPDMLLVESAWRGKGNSWRYKIASYPGRSSGRESLRRLVSYARGLGIPTIFWNKEDGIYFDRFIDSARLFDYVFTVDAQCLSKYRAVLGSTTKVDWLGFAVDDSLHHFTGFNFKHHRAVFAGGCYGGEFPRRRYWQNLLFGSACRSGLGLTVVDRHSALPDPRFRFLPKDGMELLPAVAYDKTPQLYRDYLVSLNVNTIEDSPTMCSRRLLEILACGGIAVTNPSLSVEKAFKEFCYTPQDDAEAVELFARLRQGPSVMDLERARAGALFIKENHTWQHRLQQMVKAVGL